MQFQEVSNGLVLLWGKLEDDPAWLHRRVEGIYFQGEAAQIPGGVWSRSEWVWTRWWGWAGSHNWWRGAEPEAIEDLMERNEGGKKF